MEHPQSAEGRTRPEHTATAATASTTASTTAVVCETSRFAVFAACPQCDGEMAPEHAHFRCTSCGWRDSCCD